jgi:O-antigen/teichoic acid export membrane protein
VKNTGYLTAVEVMRMLLPFVALPYVIRTIGGERYGTIVFAQTIISYFVIFINFGMDVSAVKDVSVHRNDKERLNKVVSSVLLLKLLLFLLALVVLLFGIVFIPYLRSERQLYLFAFMTCFSEILSGDREDEISDSHSLNFHPFLYSYGISFCAKCE